VPIYQTTFAATGRVFWALSASSTPSWWGGHCILPKNLLLIVYYALA